MVKISRLLNNFVIVAVATLCLATSAHAQTTTQKISFDTTDTLAQTATITYSLQVNAGPVTPLQATCVALAAGSTCTLPLSVPALKGDVFKIFATNTGGSVSTTFTDPGAPGSMGNIKIIIIIGPGEEN